MSTLIQTHHLSVSLAKKKILSTIDIQVEEGEFFTIIGANGAGKSTLLNCLCGDTRYYQGNIVFATKNIQQFSHQQLALNRAVLPQSIHIPFPIRVYDIVAMGRTPFLSTDSQQYNEQIIEDVLEKVSMSHYKTSFYHTLSGGEQHRVQIARVLAQIIAKPNAKLQGKLLFLDEPTNHLDLMHQYQLMELLISLQQQGLTIISIMHNLDLAFKYATKLMVLKEGENLGCYTPNELLNTNKLDIAYDMPIKSCWLNDFNCNVLIPISQINR